MAHNSQPQSHPNATRNQKPADMIREGYTVRVSDGQEVIVPTAFGAVELPLAQMHKPDYSNALEMDVGVSFV